MIYHGDSCLLFRCEEEACREVNEAYLRADASLKVFLEEATRILVRRPDLPSDLLADQLNVARSSLFNWLRKLRLSYRTLRNAAACEHALYRTLYKGTLTEGKYICLDDLTYRELLNSITSSLGEITSLINRIELHALLGAEPLINLHELYEKLKQINENLRSLPRKLEELAIREWKCVRSPFETD